MVIVLYRFSCVFFAITRALLLQIKLFKFHTFVLAIKRRMKTDRLRRGASERNGKGHMPKYYLVNIYPNQGWVLRGLPAEIRPRQEVGRLAVGVNHISLGLSYGTSLSISYHHWSILNKNIGLTFDLGMEDESMFFLNRIGFRFDNMSMAVCKSWLSEGGSNHWHI